MKVVLNHPVIHNGIEYSRGLHELEDNLGAHFLGMANSPAVPFNERPLVAGVRVKAVDAPNDDPKPPDEPEPGPEKARAARRR